jgi:hypothetical protein
MAQELSSHAACTGDLDRFQSARYYVASGMGGGWLIFHEGEHRAIHRQQRKLLAVETAKSIAREHAPSQVIVEREDGTFYLKYDFGPAGEYRFC